MYVPILHSSKESCSDPGAYDNCIRGGGMHSGRGENVWATFKHLVNVLDDTSYDCAAASNEAGHQIVEISGCVY